MRKLFIAVLTIGMLGVPTFAQEKNVVDEAKQQIAKEKHDNLVAKAKKLLERKADLEKQLSDVNQKLGKLESGQDTEDSENAIPLAKLNSGSGWITANNVYAVNTDGTVSTR